MNLVKHLLLLTFFSTALSVNGQWSEVEWLQMDGLSNIDFVSDETGYATMHELQGFTSSFEKTEDGGQTWTVVDIPLPSTDILDMDFNAAGEGVLGTRSYIGGEIVTKVYRTLNNGETWEDIFPIDGATGYGMGAIQLLDANTIFFVIDNYLYRTINGGQDWDVISIPEAAVSVHFSDADHGVIGTWDGSFNYFGGMLATEDGGETWNETVIEINNSVMGVVHQQNQTTAFAAPVKWGGSGFSNFYKTEDNGENWSTISIPETDDEATLTGLSFNDNGNMVITLSSNTFIHMYQSENGGETWDLQSQLDFFYISDMELTTNSGYIVGESGVILRLNDPSSVSESSVINFTAYPNPIGEGQLLQWSPYSHFNSIRVFDPAGKLVVDETLQAQQFNFSTLPPGMYMVELTGDVERRSVQVIVR